MVDSRTEVGSELGPRKLSKITRIMQKDTEANLKRLPPVKGEATWATIRIKKWVQFIEAQQICNEFIKKSPHWLSFCQQNTTSLSENWQRERIQYFSYISYMNCISGQSNIWWVIVVLYSRILANIHNNHQWQLKPVAERLMGNFVMDSRLTTPESTD